MIDNATIQDKEYGFLLNNRFYGQIYKVLAMNGNECTIITGKYIHQYLCVDLDTVVLRDTDGNDVTPSANEEKIELISDYVNWGRYSRLVLPPNYTEVIQWLGETYQDGNGVWRQKDKTGEREGTALLAGVGNFVAGDHVLTASDLTGITITDVTGTAVLQVSGNTIVCASSGTCSYLELSNGSNYWFEETTGTDVFDSSGNGLHFVRSGTVAGFYTTAEDLPTVSNRYGYNDNAGQIVPASLSNSGFDVLGNPLNQDGKLGFDPIVKSGSVTANGTDQYGVTDYIPRSDTVFATKGRFLDISGSPAQGCSDSSESRFYFGVSGGKWISAYGDNDGTANLGGDADTDYHTFIKYGADLYVMPITADISTPAKTKDLIDNNTPDITYSAPYVQGDMELYLGAIHNTGGTASNYCNFEFFETQLLRYDGNTITASLKFPHSSSSGDVDYNILEEDDTPQNALITQTGFLLTTQNNFTIVAQ